MSALHVIVDIGPGRHNVSERDTYVFPKQRSVSVGSTTGNDIVIEHGLLARNQCRITVEGARIFVTDARALYPTLVNGKRISTPTSLRPYDTISFFGSSEDSAVGVYAYLDEAYQQETPSPEEVIAVQERHQWELRKQSAHLQRIAASCPELPLAIIEELSMSYDLETLRSIAKNPNAPPSLLSKLAPSCTKEILQNPSFLLWLLEDLWLTQFSTEALLCLLSDEDIPVELLSHLATHSEDKIRCVIARHPRSTSEILAKIPIEEGSIVLGLLLSHPQMPREHLLYLAQHGNERQREMLARQQGIADFLIEILLLDESEEVRWWLVKKAKLSSEHLAVLVKDSSWRVRQEALASLK